MGWNNRIWTIAYGFLLVAFTVYAVLNTFVISQVYTVVDTASVTAAAVTASAEAAASTETDDTASEEAAETDTDTDTADDTADASGEADAQSLAATVTETVVTDNYYSDGNITITITEYREYDTTIYVADVQVSSAEYLQTAFAESTYGRNVTAKTSEIAQEVGAILAINGDYYGSQERGYVIRNGVVYRSTASADQEDLVIYEDGSFGIITEGEVSAEELVAAGAVQVLSFGPALVEDGAISVTTSDEVGKAKTSNPRTAIGIVDDLHYVLVVADGRTDESAGLTLYELATFMQSLGVETAYNLDGGGSSTMVFNGTVVNNPTSNGRTIKERSVSDIVYIGY